MAPRLSTLQLTAPTSCQPASAAAYTANVNYNLYCNPNITCQNQPLPYHLVAFWCAGRPEKSRSLLFLLSSQSFWPCVVLLAHFQETNSTEIESNFCETWYKISWISCISWLSFISWLSQHNIPSFLSWFSLGCGVKLSARLIRIFTAGLSAAAEPLQTLVGTQEACTYSSC